MNAPSEIGIDVVDIERLSNITRQTEFFIERWFHACEYKFSVDRLAGSLAAKKAMYKSLGGRIYIPPKHIFLRHDERGKPNLCLDSRSAHLLEQHCFSVSITYTERLAFAAVLTSFREGI